MMTLSMSWAEPLPSNSYSSDVGILILFCVFIHIWYALGVIIIIIIL